ncbi:cell division protein ZapA [Numidum massiliense]|uniref:cell division protein ZapA n=1 Tax=Numidum massiliense TaxID=1522315 RepID=UPI0006D5697C|nr:cell division protein ZapA [Numidum massiliense]
MGEGKKRLTVTIFGQKYTLVGSESPEYMRALASYVDETMNRIGQANARLDTVRLAILTAVNIADDYQQLRLYCEELEKQLAAERQQKQENHTNKKKHP